MPHSALAKPASRAAFCRTPISRFLDKSAKSWIGRLNDPAVPEPPGGRGWGRKRGQTYFSDLFSGPATREARAHRRGKISLSRKKRSPPGNPGGDERSSAARSVSLEADSGSEAKHPGILNRQDVSDRADWSGRVVVAEQDRVRVENVEHVDHEGDVRLGCERQDFLG